MIRIPIQANWSGKSLKKMKPRVVAPTISRYWNGAICAAPKRLAARAINMCPIVAMIASNASKDHSNLSGNVTARKRTSINAPTAKAPVKNIAPKRPA